MSHHKLVSVLLFLFLFSMFNLSPVKAPWTPDLKTKTETFKSSSSDGYLTSSNQTYGFAWNSTSGTVTDNILLLQIGQYVYMEDREAINRGFLFFETRFIPDTANITEATLRIKIQANQTDTYFNVTIQNGQPSHPHDPLRTIDYDKDHYSGNGGSRNTSTLVVGWWDLTLNSDGRSWINLTGPTKLCIRSSNDINEVAPTGNEFFNYWSGKSEVGNAPKLIVTYQYYAEEEPPSGGESGAESTSPFSLPEVALPKIPTWGYVAIIGTMIVIGLTSIMTKKPSSHNGPTGTKIRGSKKRFPKRNKKGRFT